MTGCILNSAGHVDIEPDQHFIDQSAAEDGVIFTHVRNGNIGDRAKRHFTLRWSPATLGLALGIRDHYRENAHKAFTVKLPGGQVVDAIYAGPPRVRQHTARAADVTVLLEEALITD